MKSGARIRESIGCICAFALTFAISLFLYSRIQIWNGPILGIGIDESVPAVSLSLLAAAYATFAYAVIVVKAAVSLRVFRVVLASYILVLGVVLLGKSVGISGYNFSFFQPNLISAGTLLNIAAFVPVGFLLQLKLGKPRKTVLYSFCFVIIIEIVQFAFSLGIADVIDVAANMVGIAIGLSFFLLMERRGWIFVMRDRRIKLEPKQTG